VRKKRDSEISLFCTFALFKAVIVPWLFESEKNVLYKNVHNAAHFAHSLFSKEQLWDQTFLHF